MNISFTDKQEKYIANQVKSGDFQNASEVVRDALTLITAMGLKMPVISGFDFF